MTDSLFGDEAANGPHGPIGAAAASEEVARLGRHLPEQVYLGTSSWAFAGWQGLVYEGETTEARLARHGLAAYSRHPLLRAVGIDRGYYQALNEAEWNRAAREVPERFRFVIRAPSAVTDAVTRGPRHAKCQAATANPRFLDASYAAERFVMPALEGLGEKAGPLVLQLAPMPSELTRDSPALIERIADFIARLPARHAGIRPVYAVELRNPELLTPRFVHRLRQVGARLCVGIHARMPPVARQAAALRSMEAPAQPDAAGWSLSGPLVVRWSLHAGLSTEQAWTRYAPFNRLLDADLVTRGTLVHLIRVAIRSGQNAFVIVNNKAEGCAPLSCVELARALADRVEPA
ncbi:MAG TPA: DUF72 domain-containing protein [Burkholderiaceae bacterium]|nr:DUF72 domain-containing protein [Burkholderiaceae bacterium]